jgi:hypothetical protein
VFLLSDSVAMIHKVRPAAPVDLQQEESSPADNYCGRGTCASFTEGWNEWCCFNFGSQQSGKVTHDI